MFDFLSRWTRTEHQACQDDLSAFVDGQLPARARGRVQRHLEECQTCRADLDSLRHAVALLRSTPALKPPRPFLLPASEGLRQRQVRRRRLSYGYLQAATAVATVMLVLVVSGDAVLRLQPPMPAAGMLAAREVTKAVELQQDQETLSPAPAAEPSELLKSVAVTEQPVAAPTEQGAVEALRAGQAVETATAQAMVDQEGGEPLALPSTTFSRPAAPPSPPTAEAAVELATPTETVTAIGAAAATPTPAPTHTPLPSTATLLPTHEPVLPTPTPLAQPASGELEGGSSPPPRAGLFTFLEAVRPFLPLVEIVLASALAVLLVATLWLRRRLRAV
jgi:anti-sigma factor RsiW